MAKKKPEAESPAKKGQNNPFLVMNVDKKATIGSSMKVLHAAKTLNEAKKYVDKMQGQTPEFVCILEQKAVLARQPKMTVTELDKDAVKI